MSRPRFGLESLPGEVLRLRTEIGIVEGVDAVATPLGDLCGGEPCLVPSSEAVVTLALAGEGDPGFLARAPLGGNCDESDSEVLAVREPRPRGDECFLPSAGGCGISDSEELANRSRGVPATAGEAGSGLEGLARPSIPSNAASSTGSSPGSLRILKSPAHKPTWDGRTRPPCTKALVLATTGQRSPLGRPPG